MSNDTNRDSAQATDNERREAQGDRVPFEGIVEVGGALGPSFEAQAVDVSEEGMHLRTAYLPELGQPLTCRIEVGGDVVLAAGEVVWRQEADRGGDFGLRFTDLDSASEASLRKLVSVEPTFAAEGAGSKVRLHIEGLGTPMRARIKGSAAEGLVVGSELGFLQVGKELELEDARTGGKRSARIHRVSVEVNPETQIPQLVVSLRYEQTDADAPVTTASADGADDTPQPSVLEGRKRQPTLMGLSPVAPGTTRSAAKVADDGEEEEPFPMRGSVGEAFHKASAQMGPAMSRFGSQAMTAFALVAARAKKAVAKTDEAAPPPRRTTAPPPAGALHASGRKVVRTEPISAMDALEGGASTAATKRRVAIGSAALVAAVLVFTATHKPAASPVATTDTAPSAAVTALGASAPPPPVAPATSVGTLSPAPALAPVPPEDPTSPSPQVADETHTRRRPLHVTPFGTGAVGHANVLHLKMDGAIEKIEGATTPTGFTVVIPDRRSLEAAAPLASRDSRIAAIRITNESNGAELAVSFKDGVPNYQVRAKGDSLEILLAPRGALADADESPKPSSKHRHSRH
jgi:hypothetical protein